MTQSCLPLTKANLTSCDPQTLKHPEKRAAYDAVVGLSGDAVNPFTDTSFERDQVSNMPVASSYAPCRQHSIVHSLDL